MSDIQTRSTPVQPVKVEAICPACTTGTLVSLGSGAPGGGIWHRCECGNTQALDFAYPFIDYQVSNG